MISAHEQILANPNRPSDNEIMLDVAGEVPLGNDEEDDDPKKNAFNLRDLLKGMEGKMMLYSYGFGNMLLKSTTYNKIETVKKNKNGEDQAYMFFFDGRFHIDGRVDLYPDEESFKKHPLDPQEAWRIWFENRYRVGEGEEYWYVTTTTFEPKSTKDRRSAADDNRFASGNYFKTRIQAWELANDLREVVRRYRLNRM